MENREKNVRPYSYGELVDLYGVSQRTLKTWLIPFMAEIGEKRGRYFTVKQIEVIFTKVGFPKYMPEV
jgi:DNA-binding transcriptional MerR regulator